MCKVVDLPGVMPGWSCCHCEKRSGFGMYNGNQREKCKHCGEERCSVKTGKAFVAHLQKRKKELS
jgi:hypothetical protein